jgi:hypothetical protein
MITTFWILLGTSGAIAFLAFIQLKSAQEPQILAKGTTFTPTWYVIACTSFDGLVAVYIASMLLVVCQFNFDGLRV